MTLSERINVISMAKYPKALPPAFNVSEVLSAQRKASCIEKSLVCNQESVWDGIGRAWRDRIGERFRQKLIVFQDFRVDPYVGDAGWGVPVILNLNFNLKRLFVLLKPSHPRRYMRHFYVSPFGEHHSVSTGICGFSGFPGVFGGSGHQCQLPYKQTNLNPGNENHATTKNSKQKSIFDQIGIYFRFYFALFCVFIGLLFVLLGSYIAFHKDRGILGASLFSFGLLIPLINFYLLWNRLLWGV